MSDRDKVIDDATQVAKDHAAATGETKTAEVNVDGKDVTITADPQGNVTVTEQAADPFDPPKSS